MSSRHGLTPWVSSTSRSAERSCSQAWGFRGGPYSAFSSAMAEPDSTRALTSSGFWVQRRLFRSTLSSPGASAALRAATAKRSVSARSAGSDNHMVWTRMSVRPVRVSKAALYASRLDRRTSWAAGSRSLSPEPQNGWSLSGPMAVTLACSSSTRPRLRRYSAWDHWPMSGTGTLWDSTHDRASSSPAAWNGVTPDSPMGRLIASQ